MRKAVVCVLVLLSVCVSRGALTVINGTTNYVGVWRFVDGSVVERVSVGAGVTMRFASPSWGVEQEIRVVRGAGWWEDSPSEGVLVGGDECHALVVDYPNWDDGITVEVWRENGKVDSVIHGMSYAVPFLIVWAGIYGVTRGLNPTLERA